MSPGGLLGRLHLPISVFDQICAGPIDARSVAVLRDSQYNARRLMLRSLLEIPPRAGPFSDVARVWSVLAEAERTAPEVVESVLMYPMVGVRLARALHDGPAASASEAAVLHVVAAAAAVRCGLDCVVAVPVVHGAVTLPTVGQWQLPSAGFPVGHVELRIDGGAAEIIGRGATFTAAEEHEVSADGRTLTVTVEDLDPHREFTTSLPPAPLDAVEHDEWRKLLGEAYRLLTRWHPGFAEELAAALRVLVPLGATAVVASSSSHAFGAIALSAKESATQLAEALVHEIQHSKLNALVDLVDLSAEQTKWVYAPWRDDPRGLISMLHGIYAFTSVVEFLHVQRDLVPDAEARRAGFAFALRLRQVRTAVGSLRGNTDLTDLGRAFVAGASVRLAECETAPVPAGLEATVTDLLTEHRAGWCARHVKPHPADVSALAAAWVRGAECPGTARTEIVPGSVSGGSRRRTLLEMRVLAPERFEHAVSIESADTMFARGEREAAAAEYARRIGSDPRDGDAWIGLALASRATALCDQPATVRAVHAAVATRTGTSPEPGLLAAWMAAS
ncbi:HEXXH motif domain-containing protein [Lentzea sp. NPDC055074]